MLIKELIMIDLVMQHLIKMLVVLVEDSLDSKILMHLIY